MFNRDRWLEIFDTISKNKLRTSLAGVTVALGILIFVVLYGLGNGLENTFEKFFKQEQLNTIWINPGRTSKPYAGFESNRRIEFDNDDYADIAEKFNFFIAGLYLFCLTINKLIFFLLQILYIFFARSEFITIGFSTTIFLK